MATVVTCSECERFVKASDARCPFCGAERSAESITLPRPKMARAAIVALALSAGCPSAPAYGGPPPEEQSGSESQEAPPEEEAQPEVQPEVTQPEPELRPEETQPVPRPAYGAVPPPQD